jgi:hypothetical protein
MFVDFDNIFNEDPKSQFSIPPKYIDFLNKNLPKGIKYVLDENGNCTISSEESEIKIGGMKVILNEEQKKVLGDNYQLNDVLDYSYNSQQKIEIEPIEKGFIMLNDEKFPIDKLEYNPLNPIELVDGKFYLIPPKFDCAIQLKLSDGKYQRIMNISRIPNNSIKIWSFQSNKEEPLQISYTMNNNNKEVKFNISFNLNYANSIRDVVESVYIYNAFIEGKGYIQDTLMKAKLSNKKRNKYDEKSASFWEKVLMIESEISKKFIPPKENIEYDQILEIEELYQMLILKHPIRDKNVISSLSANCDYKKDINDCINKPLFFEFNATYSTDIFDCQINLPMLLMVFNSKIVKIEKDKNESNIILEDESNEKKRYTVMMCFKDQEELEMYRKKINKNIIKVFKESKMAYEYLDKNK